MINFFRNIRRQLLDEAKLSRYTRYAFGEIILVVIGILIALQINNWNEKRKQEKEFDALISKVYTIINSNVLLIQTLSDKTIQDFRLLEYFINYKKPNSNLFKFEEIRQHFTSDTTYIDPLLNFNVEKYSEDEIEPWKFPHLLYLLEKDPWDVLNFGTLKYYCDLIEPYPNSEIQKELALKIIMYYNYFAASASVTYGVSSFLKKEHIPEPMTNVGAAASIDNLKGHYFTEEEIIKVEQLLQKEELNVELRTMLRDKLWRLDVIKGLDADSKNILGLIKKYYPNVKPNYPNLGIIGNALEGWNVPEKAMTLTNADSLIWEIDVTLKNGGIKFKSDNSYQNHWGGSEFPKGRADFWGHDIEVTPGKYHVILNLTKNTYEFIKQD